MGHSGTHSLFSSFQYSSQLLNVQYKFGQWLDSNRGLLELESTALPSEAQPLPMVTILFYSFVMAQNFNHSFLFLASKNSEEVIRASSQSIIYVQRDQKKIAKCL